MGDAQGLRPSHHPSRFNATGLSGYLLRDFSAQQLFIVFSCLRTSGKSSQPSCSPPTPLPLPFIFWSRAETFRPKCRQSCICQPLGKPARRSYLFLPDYTSKTSLFANLAKIEKGSGDLTTARTSAYPLSPENGHSRLSIFGGLDRSPSDFTWNSPPANKLQRSRPGFFSNHNCA